MFDWERIPVKASKFARQDIVITAIEDLWMIRLASPIKTETMNLSLYKITKEG